MSQYLDLVKSLLNSGISGLLIWVIWRLVDKWAGKFLTAQTDSANALGALAKAVQEGQGEQREVLLAVRVMASKLEEVKGEIRQLDQDVRKPEAKERIYADGR